MQKETSINKILFVVIGLLVMIYAVMRAYYVPFTADEAGSFSTIDMLGVKVLNKVHEGTHTILTLDLNGISNIRTANTHYLNSFLMKICSLLFGNSELSLRLPNLVALLFYIVFTYRIVHFIDNKYVRFCGFLLLNLNPFVLDFFSLARGYGIATSFAMMSLYYFIDFISGNKKVLLYAYLFAMLSAYANFITFNFYAAILSLNLLLVVSQNGFHFTALRALIRSNKRVVILNIIFLAITLPFLFLQTSTNQFYIGSNSVYNIFYSLSISSLYEKPALYSLANVLAVLCICFSVLLAVLTITKMMRTKSIRYEDVPFVILSICFLICLLQHLVLKLPLPERRTGIYFIPLFTIAMLFSYLQIGEKLKRFFRPAVITVTLLMLANFGNSMNLRYVVYSVYDANAREVYNYFKEEAEKKEGVTRVNAHWYLTGAMYYYYLMDNSNPKLDIVTVWPKEFLTQDTNVCYYYFFDTGNILRPANTRTLLTFGEQQSRVTEKLECATR